MDHHDLIIDYGDENGFTALHEAAQSGHLRVVQLLVEKGFDVNARDTDGDTPALRAATYGHLEVVQYLQQHGAALSKQVNIKGDTIVSTAAKDDYHRIVRYIAETEPHLVSCATKDPVGMTALMVAAGAGSIKTTQYIIENLPNDELTEKANDGLSVLHFAAKSGSKKVVDLILRNVTDVNIKSGDGSTALHFAVDDGNSPNVVNALISAGADGSIKNEKGDLPAHYAAARGDWDHFSMMKKLIEAAGDNCSWLNEEDSNSRSMLRIVTSHPTFTDYSLKMIDFLCDCSGLALELPCPGPIGGPPLLNLVRELSHRTFIKTIPGMPDPPTDAWQLHTAIKILVRSGASVECTDLSGNTALHVLCLGNLG